MSPCMYLCFLLALQVAGIHARSLLQQQPRVTASSPVATSAPPEYADLYTPTTAVGTISSTSGLPVLSPSLPPDSPPAPAIGSLISLVNPPPGFIPQLNATQQAAVSYLRQIRQGVATVVFRRALGNLDARDLNCGTGYINDYFTDRYIGLGKSLYRNGELCGGCVKIWCVDSICQDALVRNDTFMILDSCNDCRTPNDVVISPRGLQWLSGVDINVNPKVQVAWEFTSCAPLITGGIKMLPGDTNNENKIGINFSNTRQLLRSVTLNGQPMQRTSYGYWTLASQEGLTLRPPYTLQLVGLDQQQLVVRVAALVSQDLNVNFNS